MSEAKLKELEARIKALEDLNAEFARVFIGAPKIQPKPSTQLPTGTILDKFPEHLRQHLTVEADGKIIRTKFVSKEYWQEMNTIAKSQGFKWWTNPADPKQNHWEKS